MVRSINIEKEWVGNALSVQGQIRGQFFSPLRLQRARAGRASKAPELQLKSRYSRGFTLVDLMIAVVIIALLSAIAFPSYQEALRKVRRAEARAALLQLMQEQERYYSQKGQYIPFDFGSANGDNAEAKKFKAFSGVTASSSAYEISGVKCANETSTRSCLTLVATPGTSNVNKNYSDPVCGKLTLSTNGTKATEPETTAGICW